MRTLCALMAAALLWLSPNNLSAQQDVDAYYASQTALYIQALTDPNLQAKVRLIWYDLHNYSQEQYAVRPTQGYHLGQALPGGVILLDLSVAEDPNGNVTRFFMAHEWGHQHNHDPYMSLTPLGQFQMAMSGTQAEDRADEYATKFMKTRGYNIDGPIKFFCSLPPSPPGDAHSDGRTRAANVSKWYWGDQAPSDPCNSSIDNGDFKGTLNKILAEAPNNFENFKGNEAHPHQWLSNTKFQSASSCFVNGPPGLHFACFFRDQNPSSLIDQFQKTLDMKQWTFDGSDTFHSDDDSSDEIRIVVMNSSNGGTNVMIYPPRNEQ
jgi:hypothetical protein